MAFDKDTNRRIVGRPIKRRPYGMPILRDGLILGFACARTRRERAPDGKPTNRLPHRHLEKAFFPKRGPDLAQSVDAEPASHGLQEDLQQPRWRQVEPEDVSARSQHTSKLANRLTPTRQMVENILNHRQIEALGLELEFARITDYKPQPRWLARDRSTAR